MTTSTTEEKVDDRQLYYYPNGYSKNNNNNGGNSNSNAYVSKYLKDSSGREYDSYASAWRYLGTYMDCDTGGSSSSSSSSSSNNGGGRFRRWLSYASNWGYAYGGNKCERKILWAEYGNPNYGGGEIGEYQFWNGNGWDSSTCKSGNCAKMDCHDPYNSNWQLVGVYKEAISFEGDHWFEQLFKHEGYCVWGGDKDGDYSSYKSSSYQFMQQMREELPSGCTQAGTFSSSSSSSGKKYYIDIKPQSQGQMSLGVYADAKCTTESGYSLSDYQKYYGSNMKALGSSGAMSKWNKMMDSYKTCQPCRAYNTQYTYDSSWSAPEHRGLSEANDGQGEEEKNGFNCYDDADYRNCNQCYKFETHSDMEKASSSDLSRAHKQGTILKIQYQGNWYGSGLVGDAQYRSSNCDNGDGAEGSNDGEESGDEGAESGGGSGCNGGYGSSYGGGYSTHTSSSSVSKNYNYSHSSYYAASFAAVPVLLGLALYGYKKKRRIIVLDVTEQVEEGICMSSPAPLV